MTGYLGAKKSLDHQSDLTLARYAMQCIHLRSTIDIRSNLTKHFLACVFFLDVN